MTCTPVELARLLANLADAHDASDGICIVAAHPDDEIASAGSILPLVRDRVRILHVTSGAPDRVDEALAHGFATPDDYALAREREFAAAAVKLRLPISAHRSLGFIDQGCVGVLSDLVNTLVECFARWAPALVLTHPFEGGHPDHDATCFAVHAAADRLERQYGERPELWEFASYNGFGGAFNPLTFLGPDPYHECRLDRAAQSEKAALFAWYVTQRQVLSRFPIAVERYRPAPRYDFLLRPHDGELLYERHDWGTTWDDWRAAVARTLRANHRAPCTS